MRNQGANRRAKAGWNSEARLDVFRNAIRASVRQGRESADTLTRAVTTNATAFCAITNRRTKPGDDQYQETTRAVVWFGRCCNMGSPVEGPGHWTKTILPGTLRAGAFVGCGGLAFPGDRVNDRLRPDLRSIRDTTVPARAGTVAGGSSPIPGAPPEYTESVDCCSRGCTAILPHIGGAQSVFEQSAR